MSIYYYMVCKEHKVRTTIIAVERLDSFHLDNEDKLALFLKNHCTCKPIFLIEHNDDAYSFQEEKEK